jgi:hypothetical protein
VSAQEAIENLLECIAALNLDLDLSKLSSGEIHALLSTYGDCVREFHPENYHQERATLLRNYQTLRKCGLGDSDLASIDFS